MACWTFKIQIQWSSTNCSSHQHNYQVKAAEREKGLIFGSEWERRLWLCGPAMCGTLELSLRVQLRKRTCSGAWLWWWWKAKGTLKGEGKVSLTDTVGCLYQFPHRLPQPMSIIWPTRQKLPGSVSLQAIHYHCSCWAWLCKEWNAEHVSSDRISLEGFLLTSDWLCLSSVNFLWECV